jgi:hypothetical protein
MSKQGLTKELNRLRHLLINAQGLTREILEKTQLIRRDHKEVLNIVRLMLETSTQIQRKLTVTRLIAMSQFQEERRIIQSTEQAWKDTERLTEIITQHREPWGIDLLSRILQTWRKLKDNSLKMSQYPQHAKDQAGQRQIWVEDTARRCLDQVRMEIYGDEEEVTALLQAGMLELSLQRIIEEIEKQGAALNPN